MFDLKGDICIGCGVCVKVCPHGALSMEGRRAAMTAADRCIECAACQLNCESGAISVTKGTGCLVAIVKEDILKIAPQGCGCGSVGGSGSGCC